MKEWCDGVLELWSVGNRQFVVSKKILCLALCTVLLVLSLPAEAQQPKKVPRIGYLSSVIQPVSPPVPRQFGWLCASVAT